jgi:hypothetical protein
VKKLTYKKGIDKRANLWYIYYSKREEIKTMIEIELKNKTTGEWVIVASYDTYHVYRDYPQYPRKDWAIVQTWNV